MDMRGCWPSCERDYRKIITLNNLKAPFLTNRVVNKRPIEPPIL